jgi:hypothetical protein
MGSLVDEFAVEFKRELARLRKERHGNDCRLSKELEQVERAIKRCLDFITGGTATLDQFATNCGNWRSAEATSPRN